MSYQLLVFDWDGTLMDSQARIVACIQMAAEDLGLDVPSHEASSNIIGLGLHEAVDALFPGSDESQTQRIAEQYRKHFLGDELEPSVLFKGAREVVEHLADRYLLAVATGKSRRGLNKVLKETGLEKYFHATRCADETLSKPHPQMIREIMHDLSTDPGVTLMIGDTEYDMQMAVTAGAHGLGVSYGVHGEERLREVGAIDCLHEISDLPDWLQNGTALKTTRGDIE